MLGGSEGSGDDRVLNGVGCGRVCVGGACRYKSGAEVGNTEIVYGCLDTRDATCKIADAVRSSISSAPCCEASAHSAHGKAPA